MTLTEKLCHQLPSFEAACGILNVPADKAVPSFEFFPERDRVAIQKLSELIIIIRAANWIANGGKDWVPDWSKANYKHIAWFNVNGSSGFRFVGYDYWYHDSCVSSRFLFFNETVGDYVVSTFFEHFKAYFVIKPETV